MTEVYTKTAFVPYYAFVCPVYDFESLDDLQVIDENRLAELYAVYVYSIKTMEFRPSAYMDCAEEAQYIACKEHVRIAKLMNAIRGMKFSPETVARIEQLERGELDTAMAELLENEE